MLKTSALKKNSLLLIDLGVMLTIQIASIVLISDKTGSELFSLYNMIHVFAFALVNIIGMAAFGVYNIIWRRKWT